MISILETQKPTSDSSKLPIDELMDNDKILGNILQNLHGDVLKTCRLVCRKWRDVVQPQFKSEMNLVFEESNLRMHNSERDFESFLEDFNGCDEGLPLESVKFIITECVIKENLWSLRWLGSFGGLIKNLTVVAYHSDRQLLMNQLKAFRNIIFKYMHNLENLTLLYIASDRKIMSYYFSMDEYYDLSWIYSGEVAKIKLPGLKSIKYLVDDKCTWSYDKKNEVIRTLKYLITSAKNLQSLEMNLNPTHTGTLLKIKSKHLETLKELSLLDWNCSYSQVHRSIRILEELGKSGKLNLDSFSLQCICSPRDACYGIREVICHSKYLLMFLKSQKDCLKVLDLTYPPFPRSALNAEFKDPLFETLKGGNYLVFPKLEKLEKLSLCYSYRNFIWAFSSCSNWTELFPKLKIFDYHYIIESDNSTFPQLMNSMIVPCGSVTEINLAVNTYVFGEYLSPTENEKVQSLRLFRLVRENFPNIKRLKVTSEQYPVSEGEIDGFLHFTKTYIIWSVEDNNSEQIFVNEYNVDSEENTDGIEQENRNWLLQCIGKFQCCQCGDSDDSD